jgi:hypothetical protein
MKSLALAILGASLAAAQPDWHKHNITFGLGAGQPRADLRGLFDDSFGLEVGYGYRFHRYFQADAGLEVLFGAAGVRDFLPTGLGSYRIKDYQYLLPMGGRAIAPLLGGRLQFYGGGGGAYMRYSERVNQPSDYFRIDCPVCTTRSGWGYYGLVGVDAALDRYQMFRLGVGAKVYRGHTDGEPLGAVPGVRTRDHWVNIYGRFGFNF